MIGPNRGYPLLVAGMTQVGRFDQFDLYGGEGEIVSAQGQAVDGVAITQYQVLAMDVNGRMVPWDASEFAYASGALTFTGVAVAAETVTINGVVITWMASGAVGPQANVGIDGPTSATNLINLINGNPGSTDPNTGLPIYGAEPLAGTGVTATVDATGLIVTLHAIAPGVTGNAITTTKVMANATFGAATLTGGAAEVDTDAKQAIGIAAVAVPAATPGVWMPYFSGGVFNHEALVWPGAVGTFPQRARAFAGTGIGVRQLL